MKILLPSKFLNKARFFSCLLSFCLQSLAFLPLSAEEKSYYSVRGQVRETFNNHAIVPFAHIIANDEHHFFADMEGRFIVTLSQPIKKMIIKSHFFRPATVNNPTDNTEIEVTLNRYLFFYFDEYTLPQAQDLMQKVVAQKENNNPLKQKPFDYQAYTKLVFTSDSLVAIKRKANNLLKYVSRHVNQSEKDHHLFVMESATQRRYEGELRQQELVQSTNVSGIKSKSALTLMSQWQPFSLYDDYVNIAGSNYISPLAGNIETRYIFAITDTAVFGKDTIYTVKFNPLHARQVAALKGFLYVNTNGYGIQFAEAMPARDVESRFAVYLQSAQNKENKQWFPAQTKTQIQLKAKGIPVQGSSKTYIYRPRFGRGKGNMSFEETILDFTTGQPQDSTFWKKARQENFTEKDEETFRFYDSMGNARDFDKFLGFGSRVAQGELPIRKIDIALNRLIRLGEYEGVRLGLGAHTNEKFSDKHVLGGYFGYGFRDKQWKYQVLGETLLYPEADLKLGFSQTHEIGEPGAVYFAFDRLQYSSETQRRYRLPVMDKYDASLLSLKIHPMTYTWLMASMQYKYLQPQYSYSFEDKNITSFSVAEAQVAMRYSFGEKYVKLPNERISLGSKYPELWVQYTKSLENLGADFGYQKIDAKLQYKRKILGFGESGLQLISGYATGTLPYQLLYNAKGSYRELSTITHNSFETMNYNEFVSDKYFAVHFSHNFGKMYIPGFPFYPSILISHNLGYGSLRNTALHGGVKFKTMEKGYLESGFFINDIFVLQLGSLKTGVGAGTFFRYGAYRLPNASDNVFFKFALTFNV